MEKLQEAAEPIFEFGDYCSIEQNRFGADNEFYTHKVIGVSKSNGWVDVPVVGSAAEVLHDSIEWVVSCICCGVSETEVLKYRMSDCKLIHKNHKLEHSKEVIEELVKALKVADAFIENLDYTKHGLATLETIREALTKIRNNEK